MNCKHDTRRNRHNQNQPLSQKGGNLLSRYLLYPHTHQHLWRITIRVRMITDTLYFYHVHASIPSMIATMTCILLVWFLAVVPLARTPDHEKICSLRITLFRFPKYSLKVYNYNNWHDAASLLHNKINVTNIISTLVFLISVYFFLFSV